MIQAATQDAQLNHPDDGPVLVPGDVVLGTRDFGSRSFTPFAPGSDTPNAVRVVTQRSGSNGNALPLVLAPVVGLWAADVAAAAVAVASGGGSGTGTRFLLDDELIDSDIPAIEELADRLDMDPEGLISDLDGDFFVDLPPGETLELPTGQVGDEGLFDIDHSEFQFTEESSPSFNDFLNWNDDGTWRHSLVPDDMLDPLIGVSPVNDPSVYPTFVSDFVHVSPLYKSDTSALNPVPYGDGTVPAVNAKGYRRGLLAFKIIEIVDPSLIDLDSVGPANAAESGSVIALVQ